MAPILMLHHVHCSCILSPLQSRHESIIHTIDFPLTFTSVISAIFMPQSASRASAGVLSRQHASYMYAVHMKGLVPATCPLLVCADLTNVMVKKPQYNVTIQSFSARVTSDINNLLANLSESATSFL